MTQENSSNLVLSICIPSYNRKKHLRELIKSISVARSNEFEIYVLDNHSEEDFSEEMSAIDKRVRFFRKKANNGALLNGKESVCGAKGEYALICLDKDMIHGEELDEFIEFLKSVDVYGGYCRYPSLTQDKKGTTVFHKEDLLRTGYRKAHPTGYFYKTEVYQKEIEKYDFDIDPTAFMSDMVLTTCAAMGDFLVYKSGLVEEGGSLEECVRQPSFTYSPQKKNVYFLPERRAMQFDFEARNIYTLKTTKRIKTGLIYKTAWQYVWGTTSILKSILSQKEVCYHYYVKPRIMSHTELMKNYRESISFIRNNRNVIKVIDNMTRLIIYIKVRFWLSLIISSIKK